MKIRFSPYPLVFLLAALLFTLAACDSGGAGDGVALDGDYQFNRFAFDVSGFDATVNVLDTLDVATLRLFGGDNEFNLVYSFVGSDVRSRIEGSFSFNGEEVSFEINEGNPSRLLLPSTEGDDFELQVSQDGGRLTGSIERQEVDLSNYGIDQTVDGTLELRLTRQ